jgi:hypothetical protein
MNFVSLFTAFIIISGFWLNSYKFELMNKNNLETTPYKIFPWQKNPILSKSNPHWLIIHLASSLIQISLTALIIFTTNDQYLKFIHFIGHCIFSLILIYNITTFADLSKGQAVIGNSIPLLLSFLAISSSLKYKYFFYLLCLSPPILLESFLKYFFY